MAQMNTGLLRNAEIDPRLDFLVVTGKKESAPIREICGSSPNWRFRMNELVLNTAKNILEEGELSEVLVT